MAGRWPMGGIFLNWEIVNERGSLTSKRWKQDFDPSYIFILEINVETPTQGNAYCVAGMILIIIKPDGDHSEKSLYAVISAFK